MTPARILLVDDEPNLLLMVGDQLKMEGHDVITATNGEDALQALRLQPAHLIILDISMPGMTGLALLKKLSGPDGKPRYPILVFTARSNMELFFKTTGVEGFLSKDSDPAQLVAEVRRILNKTRPPAPVAAAGTAKPPKVALILEDDPKLNRRLKVSFTVAGYETHILMDSHHLAEALQAHPPSVILLKSVLPGISGGTLATQLADYASARGIPVILYDASGINTTATAHPNVDKFVPSDSPAELLKAVASITR